MNNVNNVIKNQYRNCEAQTNEPVQGEIKGKIPEWLKGTLFRNGPGIMKIGADEYDHMFDGMAVLHRYHIENGQATYTSRALESDTYKRNMKANRIVVSEFGTAAFPDPCESIFSRLKSKFSILTGAANDKTTDNCLINVGFHGDQLYAMTETSLVRRIDPETLNTIGGKVNISDYVAVNSSTAHPHILEDGTVLNVGNRYSGRAGARYCFFSVPPNFGSESEETNFKDAKLIGEIPFSSSWQPTYFHSFGLTKNYLIFIESPLVVDVKAIVTTGLTGNRQSYNQCMHWNPEAQTKIHVLSLETGKKLPVTYTSEAMFTFHHINAYEEDNQLIVDVAGYDNGGIVMELNKHVVEQDNLKHSKATPRRFVLPLDFAEKPAGTNLVTIKGSQATAAVTEDSGPETTVHCTAEDLGDQFVELPRINYRYNTKPYKYYYSMGTKDKLFSFDVDCLLKGDVTTKEVLLWSEEGMAPGEPIFVPNPAGQAEDDGVLLAPLINSNVEKEANLLILDAKNMKEIARATFKTKGAFTTTFHGQFAGADEKVHLY